VEPVYHLFRSLVEGTTGIEAERCGSAARRHHRPGRTVCGDCHPQHPRLSGVAYSGAHAHWAAGATV